MKIRLADPSPLARKSVIRYCTYMISGSKKLSNPYALTVTNGVGTSLGAEGAGGKYLTLVPSFSRFNVREEVE